MIERTICKIEEDHEESLYQLQNFMVFLCFIRLMIKSKVN